jgi:hypothetical protein
MEMIDSKIQRAKISHFYPFSRIKKLLLKSAYYIVTSACTHVSQQLDIVPLIPGQEIILS